MSETKHSPLPWQWHPESKDQAHTGAVFRLERPGHAYAIAMKPRYVTDEEWAADAAFIVLATSLHHELVSALSEAILHLRFAQSGFTTPEIDNDWLNKRDQIVDIAAAVLAKAKQPNLEEPRG